MASSARLVTIKRSGDDGAHFPLTLSSCLFGRSIECDIRIQLPVVSKKHCKIEINDQQAILHNFSSTNPTQVNGATVDEPVQLKHGDIITIIDRSFRYENGNHEDGSRSTGFPGKSFGQEPVQQASRASFSDPDGKGQDASTSKTTSRRSLVHAKRLSGDSSASGSSKDSITQDPSNTCSSGHVEQHSGRNIEEPTSDVLFKKSRAAGSSSRELKSSPAQSLSNSKKHESPFKKLYQSMKEELNIKSQKQSRRKSEPQPECAAGKETWETKLLVSCKSRAKSSGSIPGSAVSSPKVGKIWTEPLQTSTEALSSSFSLAETAEMKTPVRNSQQLKNEVSGRRESVDLNESEGATADYKIVTPRKLATRNQTPVKVEGAASPAGKPENISCKKRKSLPAKIEVLSTETQSQFSSTHHLASDEKKTPKDSFSKPEKLATAARQIYSGLPGLSSVDISNFGDSINKSEGMSLKRRRVSFGGHLRPELFDENLPPNTPLKRGETPTKRKSLAPHTPSVLKKIIKERPQSPGKQESPGITLPSPNDQRRRSGRSAPASSGSESLPQTYTPKKASRKSGNLPAKRASISRSQHDILQMISSKRRSGASEANLIVAKSWADVVKLGTKQTQTKVVKHVPQKQASKRQRRPNTPKKPTSSLHNQFSTGHANSPCTIVIGRAQIEKVSMPARPYKMLNNLMLNQKIDFSEDLSGLTEMFKTPVKEKQQQMNDMGSILSNSENLPEKQFQVTNSGDKPLPFTSEILGENALSSTQNAAKEPSDKYSTSPTLRQRSIKNGNTVQTPENVQNITHLEKKTPGSVTEPLKTVSSVRKLRRSRELRHTLGESMNESTEADLDQGIIVRYLRKTSLQGQEVDRQVQDSEKCSQRFKESVELKEDPEKTSAMRSSARKQKPAKDLIGSQMVTQTAACAEELFNQEKGTTEKPEESMHKQSTPISDGQRATKQKADKVLCKTPQPTTNNTKTSTKPWHSTSGKKVDMKEEHSEQKKFAHTSGGTRHTPKVPELAHGGIKALKESENRMLDLTVTGSKKPVGKAKEKAQPMQDLTGFHELFLSPVPGDKTAKMSNKSPYPEFPELARTPASIKRLSKTGLGKGDVREELSTLGKRRKSPGRTSHTPIASELEENDTTAFVETPKQKLDFTENSAGSKRRSRTPKMRAQPLEDLDGFQELFQTPAGTSDPVTVGETTKVSLESLHLEPVRTPASTKRLSKAGFDKADEKEKLSTVGKQTKSPGRTSHTPTAPVLEENDTTALVETPKQKLDFTENSAGSKRRSRTPKMRAQPLEDLDGFQELFQTPAGTSDLVTVGETTKVSLESLQPAHIRTPASTKRLSKAGLDKADEREKLSTLGKQTKSPGRTSHTPTAPVLEENVTTALVETPKQKLDFTENSAGSKRRSRTPKMKVQPLEDLDGFQELFQTPAGTSDPVTVGETTKVSLESLQPAHIRTPASTKRLSKAGLDKADEREKLSTLGKRTKSPGRTSQTPTAPVLEENVTTAFVETPKQKLDFIENSAGSKRRSRTPKMRAQPLEDLDGFQELFQTPAGDSNLVTIGKITKVFLESPQPEPVRTPASTKRLSKAGLGNADMREELSTLGKRTKLPGRASRTPTSAGQQEKGIKEIMETSSKKLESLGNLTGSKKQSRTPKKEGQSLEDLPDCQELFQTPDPLVVGKTKRMSFNSPQPDPVITLRSIKRQSRASMGKMEVKEEFSESEKCQQIEKAIDTLQVSNDSNVIRAPKQSAKRKLDSAASLPSSKRLRRASKDKTPCLEDLSGFQQLFQTPGHSKDSLAIGETLKMPTKSPQSGPLRNHTSRKSLPKISLGKTDVTEELSALQKQLPGKAPTASVQMGEGIQAIRKTSKDKLETAVSVIEFTRQRRAPKVKALPLEDLDGIQELFQTPGHSTDPVIGNKRTSMSLRSPPQPGIVRTLQTSKRLAKTSLGKEHMREEISSVNMLGCAVGEIVHTSRLQEDDGRENKDLEESRILTLGPSVNLTGSKKQRGTHKKRSQSPEDIFDLQELFQTPASHKDSVTLHETTKMSLESSEHFRTPASTKRLSKAGLDKADEREELSALGKRTKSPGRTSHTPIAPVLEENDITALVETPKQKLDFTENSAGSKRRSRTPKMRAQPLEDLDGFQELFQTPAGTSDPVTVGETTKVSLESLQPAHIRTPASTKRLSKAGLGKVDEREKLSTLGKQTKSSGRTSHTPTGPVLEENVTTAFVETPKQKLDFTENSAGSKRRSRTPKMRAQPLEDLDGFQELFQTLAGASDPVTVGETTKVSLESLQAEPVRTPASTKRLSKTGFGKVDVREQLSPLNKQTCSAQEDMHVLRLSENDVTGTKDLKESAAQILNPAVSVTSSKRQQGACKKKSQFPEDLSGLQELFQTPGHDKDSLAGDKLTKMPHRSLPPEPINTSVTSQRQSRARRMKVHMKSELSGDRMLPQMSEEIMDISTVPECEDKGIRTRKQSVKRKLDTAVSVPSSKRQRVARAEKAQTLEDLTEFQELYQTPSLAVEPVIVDKATKMPSKSPEPVDTTSETQTGRRLRRVGVMKEPLAQRKTTRVLRETRNTYKEPVGDNKDVKEFKESSMQKQDPAVILTGRRRQPRTLKEKTQPLKELPSIQEETATRISCEFPQPEEKESSASSERQLRIQLCKGVKEEPTAQRKPRGRVTRNTLKEPMSDSGNVEELKESTKRKIDPVASVPVSKRPRRVPREKTQPLEVTGPIEPVQIPGHTEELASDERPTRVPCDSLQSEQADNLQTSLRRLRTRRGKIEVDQKPSVVKKTVPTSRQTTRSRKVPEIDDKDTQASKESGEQQLETVANVTGSRRQLRAHKNEVQPFEVLGDSKKLIQMSEHTEKLRHDTSTLKSTIQQMPDPIKPLRTSRRVLRASKEDTVETVEMSVDTRDPAESQSKSNTFLSPKRKSARGRGGPRTRGLCSVTPQQEAIDEKPAPKRQRAAPSKRHVSPEPVKMKHLRIMSSKTEPVEEQISNVMKTKEEVQVENSTPPDQKMPLPSRYRKKNSEKHPRPKVGASTEKDGMKTNEKTTKSSQETELQNTDDGAKKSTSRGKVSGKRTCLRSGGQSENPQPCAAEKTSETGAEILKTQKEKGVSGELDARSLRSRKTGATLDSEPNPKVTRGAKKDIKVPKKDEDIVYTTKLRTRSHKNS
ncbi:proliferation marker protein Ki-67 isoform X2 [Microtus pennsylvanicus]|uniref:proliferation marker protein Ki-67 isoform X2 n=1 Tax=Microtus pennsylvanicus TaxID=10058 RepID=UPI003F6CFBB0